jgi:two-component system chemotaxis response regulator CheY
MNDQKIVLLIDQATDARSLLAIHLEGMGFKVFEAENLSQINGILSGRKVDLVVTEWALPGLGGEALIKALEPDKRPVLLFTEQVIENAVVILNRLRVTALVSKKKRSDLLNQISRLTKPDSETIASPKDQIFGKHILLLEDSSVVRHFIQRAIEKENRGWAVIETGDGPQALVEAGRRHLDLVIADLEIPGLDGLAFLKLIRAKPLLKLKPILALAASSRRDLRDAFKADPYVLFLPKPVVAEQIVEAIHVVFGEKKVPAEI